MLQSLDKVPSSQTCLSGNWEGLRQSLWIQEAGYLGNVNSDVVTRGGFTSMRYCLLLIHSMLVCLQDQSLCPSMLSLGRGQWRKSAPKLGPAGLLSLGSALRNFIITDPIALLTLLCSHILLQAWLHDFQGRCHLLKRFSYVPNSHASCATTKDLIHAGTPSLPGARHSVSLKADEV